MTFLLHRDDFYKPFRKQKLSGSDFLRQNRRFKYAILETFPTGRAQMNRVILFLKRKADTGRIKPASNDKANAFFLSFVFLSKGPIYQIKAQTFSFSQPATYIPD
jgi:hypothetical protein